MSLIIPPSKGSPTEALPIANSTKPQAASWPLARSPRSQPVGGKEEDQRNCAVAAHSPLRACRERATILSASFA